MDPVSNLPFFSHLSQITNSSQKFCFENLITKSIDSGNSIVFKVVEELILHIPTYLVICREHLAGEELQAKYNSARSMNASKISRRRGLAVEASPTIICLLKVVVRMKTHLLCHLASSEMDGTGKYINLKNI